jgi:hypothetical protein
MSSIVEDWISRANAKQRRGRAGRVKPGLCFCLYTRHRFENIMRPFQVTTGVSYIYFFPNVPLFCHSYIPVIFHGTLTISVFIIW